MGSHSARVSLPATRRRWTRPALTPARQNSSPAPDLPTLEGWKAKLTLVLVAYIPQTATHPSITMHLIASRPEVHGTKDLAIARPISYDYTTRPATLITTLQLNENDMKKPLPYTCGAGLQIDKSRRLRWFCELNLRRVKTVGVSVLSI